MAAHRTTGRGESSKCFVHLLSVFVILCATALVFAMIFLRPETPTLQLRSATVADLSYANSSSSLSSFNLTLAAQLVLNNPNFGPFSFENSTTSLLYGNATVGEGQVGEGGAKARETHSVNVTVEARSGNALLDAKSLSSDLESGFLKLWSYTAMSGEVKLMDLVSRRESIEMNCSFSLHLQSRQVHDLLCT